MIAVIFDMDGVLADTEPCHVAAEKLLFKAFGIDLTTEYLQGFMGNSYKTVIDSIIKKYQLDASANGLIPKYQKYIATFYEENATPIQNAVELVKSLFDAQVSLALASSSSHQLIKIVLNKFDLNDYFSVVISGEDVAYTKPNPEIFLKTAEQLNIDPEDCLVIEDSAHGVKAAKSAGMTCVGFRSPNSGNQDLSLADIIIHNISELSVDRIKSFIK